MEKPVSHQGAVGSKPLTTFVQVDTNTFREVVQRLTGPSENAAAHEGANLKVSGVKRPTFKLHERRQYTRPKLEIVKPCFHLNPTTTSALQLQIPDFHSPSNTGNSTGILHSPVGTPSSTFSKLSILERENKEEPAVPQLNSEEEEKAIKERRFYLHPSPRSRPGHTEPELLTLFPLTCLKTSEKP
ncbi:hypothetical protein L1049_021180 [Liquidambar formosana]|uniref:VQ domain-containing protein n=1 Tax=Liquidambar formosana TaxID=63359 RepID=A0AAP0SE68_LIQFO